MNYRTNADESGIFIVATEAAADRETGFGDYLIAKRELTLMVRAQVKETLAALAAAVRVKERDLPVEQAGEVTAVELAMAAEAAQADKARVEAWRVKADRLPACTAFPAGPERQAAYLIEDAERKTNAAMSAPSDDPLDIPSFLRAQK